MRTKDVVRGVITLAIIAWGILSYHGTVNADDAFVEPVKMRVTCYTATGNPTATGVTPFYGGCAAKREWMGGAAVLYTLDGEYVGVWDINDTGGHKRIKNGSSLDLFFPTREQLDAWVKEYGDYMLVQILPDAKG